MIWLASLCNRISATGILTPVTETARAQVPLLAVFRAATASYANGSRPNAPCCTSAR